MKNETKQRMTYAQKFLYELVEKRELRKWCQQHNLDHPAIYRIAVGEKVPTYRTICSMCNLIAPALWMFFSDEQIPYEVRTVPQWDCSVNPTFVVKHKKDYKYLAERYDLQPSIAQNIFINNRTKLSLELMRLFSQEADPVEFFTLDESLLNVYVPERGDIINLASKNWVVLSDELYSQKNNAVFVAEINEKGKGPSITDEQIKGNVDLLSVGVISYSRMKPIKVGNVNDEVVKEVSNQIVRIFE